VTSDPAVDAHYARLNAERRLPRRDPQTLRAAWWALRAVRRARRDLKTKGLQARVTPPPAGLPWGSRTGVNGVLNRLSPTCLERALVLQSWLTAHEIPRDVVVGVRHEASDVKAHAWVEGVAHPSEYEKYHVIHRIPAQG
jgi:hypothetical protein